MCKTELKSTKRLFRFFLFGGVGGCVGGYKIYAIHLEGGFRPIRMQL